MLSATQIPVTICRICNGLNIISYCDVQEWLVHAKKQTDARLFTSTLIEKDPRFYFESFFRCSDCESCFVAPVPTGEDLTFFYKSYYASQGYMDKSEKKLKRSIGRIKQIKKYVKHGTFLDIGCNLGYMVEAAQLHGFVATGIEIDPQAVDAASKQFPKNTFLCSNAEDLAKTGKQFDVLYCSEVIEHVPDIGSFVKALAALCRQGGYVYITTPDVVSVKNKQQFIAWEEVRPPEHLQWFSKKGIKTILEREGFAVKKFMFNLKPGIKLLAKKL